MSYFDDKIGSSSDSDNDDDNNSNSDTSSTVGGGNEIDDVEADAEIDVDADDIIDDVEDVDDDIDIEELNKDDAEEKEEEEEEDAEQEDNDDENIDGKKIKTVPTKNVYKKPVELFNEDDDEDEDDDNGEQYLQKFDQSINDNYILNFHPESNLQNYNEILSMTNVVRNSDGIIIDDLHKTIPYLTKYEKARILGQRAKQINSGHHTFVKVPENVIDGYIIAEMELKLKRIPFIIRRPLPNGGSEYWKVQDLENISF
jgi:DNA-directed RNA polymerase I, II, and III subunit RPABC2